MTEGTFLSINKNIQCFVSNEINWDQIKGYVKENKLFIECINKESNIEISWMIIGERKDSVILESIITDENGKLKIEIKKENNI